MADNNRSIGASQPAGVTIGAWQEEESASGWTHIINGVNSANMAKVNTVAKASIAKINGV